MELLVAYKIIQNEECSALRVSNWTIAAGLMITTLVSYLSHSQIWALQEENWLHVGGTTNRATITFANDMEDMLNEVPELAQPQQQQQAAADWSGAEGNGARATANGNRSQP